ncbi:MAG: XRE family transcriptional regulator [Methyloglobulus sp.]|nr:XRE family transcriptional regulator [Methyloglobulus sp.]
METPSPTQIKEAREKAGLTQSQAAALIYKGLRTWQGWEAPVGEKGHRKMDIAFWELYNMKVALNAHK